MQRSIPQARRRAATLFLLVCIALSACVSRARGHPLDVARRLDETRRRLYEERRERQIRERLLQTEERARASGVTY
jgi:hypothetical protein